MGRRTPSHSRGHRSVLTFVLALVSVVAVLAPVGDAVAAAAPLPVVTSVSPTAGPLRGGTAVTIHGSHFSHVSWVKIGGTKATKVHVASSTTITAVVPRHKAGSATISVHQTSGTSKASAARFHYVAAPRITGMSSHSGPVTGEQTVTIKGTGLSYVSRVEFGTSRATVLAHSTSTALRVSTPARWAGTVRVKVTTAGGVSPSVAADTYEFRNPAPQSTATLTPATGTAVADDASVTAVTGGGADPGGSGSGQQPWTVTLAAGGALPTAGQGFVLRPGGRIHPSGLAGTVTAVDTSAADGTAAVTVTPSAASLTSVMATAQSVFSGPLGDSQGSSSAAPAGRVRVQNASSLTSTVDFGSVSASVLECGNSDGVSVSVTGSLSLKLQNVQAHVEVRAGSVVSKPYVSVWLSYEPTLSLSLSASAEATCSLPAAWQNTHRKMFVLGDTGATIAIAPDASFSVSAKGTLTFQQHSYRMLGFQSNPDGSLRRLDGKSSDPAKATVSAELEAKAYAGAQIQVGELDVVGVGMSIGGGLKGGASADWPPRLCLNLTPYLQGTLYAYLNAWVKEWKLQAFTVELDLGGIENCTGQGWHVAWQSMTYGITDLTCPTESRCVAVGGNGNHGYVLRTADGGTTWAGKAVPAQENFTSVSCTDGTHCVAGGWGGKVSVTADSGATWSQVPLPEVYSSLGSVYWVTCVPGGTCYALAAMTRYSGTLVYGSTDQGRTWNYLALSNGSLAAMACVTASACVAVGPYPEIGRQLPRVAVSTSDGWSSTITGSVPSGWYGITGVSCASRSLCYAAGIGPQGKALRSTDFGRSWHSVDGGGLTRIAWDTSCVPSSTYCALGGDAQSVTATRDSGTHWSRTTVSGFPSSDDMNLFNVSCASRGHCVATEHGGYGKTAIVVS